MCSVQTRRRDDVEVKEELELRVGSGRTRSGYPLNYFVYVFDPERGWVSLKERGVKVDWDWISRSKRLGTVRLRAEDFEEGTLIKYEWKTKRDEGVEYYAVEDGAFRKLEYEKRKERVEEYEGHEIWRVANILENGFVDTLFYYTKGIYSSEIPPSDSLKSLKKMISRRVEEHRAVKLSIPPEVCRRITDLRPLWASGVVAEVRLDRLSEGEEAAVSLFPAAKSKRGEGYYYNVNWRTLKIPRESISIILDALKREGVKGRLIVVAFIGESAYKVKPVFREFSPYATFYV